MWLIPSFSPFLYWKQNWCLESWQLFLVLNWFQKGRKRERNIDYCFLYAPWPEIKPATLVICPEWELNPWPFGVWHDAPTEPHQPGPGKYFLTLNYAQRVFQGIGLDFNDNTPYLQNFFVKKKKILIWVPVG